MNILIVDDDNVSRTAVAQIMSSLGTQAPMEVSSGSAAMAALNEGYQPDLIITDIRMPEVDGIEMLDLIRQDVRFAPVPVMMVTSAPDQMVVKQAMQIGVQGFILKPVTPEATQRARIAIDRFHAGMIEPPQSAARRLSIGEAKYWSYLHLLGIQNRKLLDAVRLTRSGEGDLLPEEEAALRKLLETCLNLCRMFAVAHLKKALLSLDLMLKTHMSVQDERFAEVLQAIELNQHWLDVFIDNNAPDDGGAAAP